MEVYYRFLTREKDKIDNYFLKLQDKKGAKEKPEPIEVSKVEEVKEPVVMKEERGVDWYKERYEKNREHILTGKAIEDYIDKPDKKTRLSSYQFFGGAMEFQEDDGRDIDTSTKSSFHSILLERLEVLFVSPQPQITIRKKSLPKIRYRIVDLKKRETNEVIRYPALDVIAQRLKHKGLESDEFLVIEQLGDLSEQESGEPKKFCWIVDVISKSYFDDFDS